MNTVKSYLLDNRVVFEPDILIVTLSLLMKVLFPLGGGVGFFSIFRRKERKSLRTLFNLAGRAFWCFRLYPSHKSDGGC